MKNLCELEKVNAEKKTMELLHETIHKTIEEWPDWKKQAYNDNFAVSKYSKKLIINEK
ncbi:hypothetical protein [Tissierella sp. Yu-01]|jgi:hypothetical protein|uniref:hypothetical protein n=1 Tax=Tissierella sp. Yu-01 TaxID=3035694 RepID=UPI00240DFDE1|nr:hypothetical protein [Tissierella sp. Yu-01]WFA08544.1 hypothetical protein P3962_12555 [Tissierella sp. Yu-01]